MRFFWYFINVIFFKSSFFPFNFLKIFLLQLFGCSLGKGVVIKPNVNIKYPWKLSLGNYVWIGESVWIDNLDNVTIGNHVCISQGAILICGSHNYKKQSFDLITKEITKLMIPNNYGRIITMSSVAGLKGGTGRAAYGASKGAIGQLTRAMAEAWSSHGICVNAIGPGFFPTELTQIVFEDAERSKRNADQTCIGRNGEMEDLDGPLLFLCSEASRYVTGQVLMVDGGFTAK